MKSTINKLYVGIDICKAKLDVHCNEWKSVEVFPNDKNGINALFRALQKVSIQKDLHLVCEATGGYEKTLLSSAFSKEISISLINPRQIRDFAKAGGILAKTDAIDASVITHYAETFHPRLATPPSKEIESLQQAVRHRSALVKQRMREENMLTQISDSFVKKDIQSSIKSIKKRITKMEDQIQSIISADENLARKSELMQELQGVGPVVSSSLLAEMPELGSISNNQAASLLGVAPFNDDSGPRKGKRRTKGGREFIRKTIYMPILSAIRYNPIFKDFYNRLISKGKPHHVAAIAVMRKLICLINRMLSDPDFKPQKIN